MFFEAFLYFRTISLFDTNTSIFLVQSMKSSLVAIEKRMFDTPFPIDAAKLYTKKFLFEIVAYRFSIHSTKIVNVRDARMNYLRNVYAKPVQFPTLVDETMYIGAAPLALMQEARNVIFPQGQNPYVRESMNKHDLLDNLMVTQNVPSDVYTFFALFQEKHPFGNSVYIVDSSVYTVTVTVHSGTTNNFTQEDVLGDDFHIRSVDNSPSYHCYIQPVGSISDDSSLIKPNPNNWKTPSQYRDGISWNDSGDNEYHGMFMNMNYIINSIDSYAAELALLNKGTLAKISSPITKVNISVSKTGSTSGGLSSVPSGSTDVNYQLLSSYTNYISGSGNFSYQLDPTGLYLAATLKANTDENSKEQVQTTAS